MTLLHNRYKTRDDLTPTDNNRAPSCHQKSFRIEPNKIPKKFTSKIPEKISEKIITEKVQGKIPEKITEKIQGIILEKIITSKVAKIVSKPLLRSENLTTMAQQNPLLKSCLPDQTFCLKIRQVAIETLTNTSAYRKKTSCL